jgi:hypothetical protein
MNSIAFIDTEIEPKSRKILDIGGVKGDGNSFHSNSITDFITFLSGTEFICGHNILNHDFFQGESPARDSPYNYLSNYSFPQTISCIKPPLPVYKFL